MKKFIRLMVLTLSFLFLTGCSDAVPDENTISVDKKGRITCTIVEDFEKSFYDAEELQGEIEEDIKNYNKNFGTDHLSFKSFEVEDGVAKLQLTFDEARYYADYTGKELFVGTVKEAQSAGYSLEDVFLDEEGEDLFNASEWEKYHIVILEEPVRVELPKEILNFSASVVQEDKKTATVQEETTVYIIYK